MSDNKWSSSLTEKTLSRLQDLNTINPLDDCLHFKCIDGRYGKISAANIISDRYEIEIKSSSKKEYFKTAIDLVEAGWVID